MLKLFVWDWAKHEPGHCLAGLAHRMVGIRSHQKSPGSDTVCFGSCILGRSPPVLSWPASHASPLSRVSRARNCRHRISFQQCSVPSDKVLDVHLQKRVCQAFVKQLEATTAYSEMQFKPVGMFMLWPGPEHRRAGECRAWTSSTVAALH